jgi:hypothetical protein
MSPVTLYVYALSFINSFLINVNVGKITGTSGKITGDGEYSDSGWFSLRAPAT